MARDRRIIPKRFNLGRIYLLRSTKKPPSTKHQNRMVENPTISSLPVDPEDAFIKASQN
jgi:hypothetical protein